MRQLVIGEFTPELIMGKNIVLTPESYDAMLELKLYMNSIGCTMYKMPAIGKDKIDAITRIKFDIARNPKDINWYNIARKMINFDSLKERKCINIVSLTEHWQSDITYYQKKEEFEIIEIILPENYQCLFNEKLVDTCPFFRHYKEDDIKKWTALARDIRFGSY